MDARNEAIYDGNVQIIGYVARNLDSTDNLNISIDEILENDDFLSRAVTGIVQGVTIEEECPLKIEETVSQGPMYEAGVLLYVSNESLKRFEGLVYKELKAFKKPK